MLNTEKLLSHFNPVTGESRMMPLRPNGAVYVPAHTAHRTMNVGQKPLTYIGVYPAKAGHDYGAIAKKIFVASSSSGRPANHDRKK